MTDGTHSRRHTATQRAGAAVTFPCRRGGTRRGPDSNRRAGASHRLASYRDTSWSPDPRTYLPPSSRTLKIHLTRAQELSVFKKMHRKNGVQDP